MSVVTGPVWAALVLLIVASAPKMGQPFDTVRALRMAGLRVPPIVVRAFGAVEAAIGAIALVTGHPLALGLAALSYLAFGGFVALALVRKTPLSSCGCFGKADSPPTVLHAVIVTLFALALTIGAFAGRDAVGLLPQLALHFGTGLLTAAFAAIICWFAYLAMTALPALTATAAQQSSTEGTRA